MKTSKKTFLIIGIVAVVIIAIIIAVVVINSKNKPYNKNVDTAIADTINNNSKLPAKYMSGLDKNDSNLSKFKRLDNYMSTDFSDTDVFFSYYGYPNDESDHCLGEIKLLTNKYNILGVTVGDNMKESISKIEKYGFKLEESKNDLVATLEYKDITITIDADVATYVENGDNKIETIKIKIKSEYLGNRIY